MTNSNIQDIANTVKSNLELTSINSNSKCYIYALFFNDK